MDTGVARPAALRRFRAPGRRICARPVPRPRRRHPPNCARRVLTHTPPADPTDQPQAWLVYDGACPFCSAYVRHVRVREAVGRLHLVDARHGGAVVEQVRARGMDLDRGMVLKLGGRFYHGADCMHVLASLGTRSGAFNRLNAVVFASPTLSRWIYPLLRAARNATLALLGRRAITRSPPARSATDHSPPTRRPPRRRRRSRRPGHRRKP